MHVGLVVGRRIEVDHVGDVVEVEATCGDVGRDEHVVRTAREPAERPLALGLRHAAVQLARAEAFLAQVPREAVGAALRAHEDQREPTVGGELAHERSRLLRVLDGDEPMRWRG